MIGGASLQVSRGFLPFESSFSRFVFTSFVCLLLLLLFLVYLLLLTGFSDDSISCCGLLCCLVVKLRLWCLCLCCMSIDCSFYVKLNKSPFSLGGRST